MRNFVECLLKVKICDINGFCLIEYIEYIVVKVKQGGTVEGWQGGMVEEWQGRRVARGQGFRVVGWQGVRLAEVAGW